MASSYPYPVGRDVKPPPRPKTPDHIPTPFRYVSHPEAFMSLINDNQRYEPIKVHRMPAKDRSMTSSIIQATRRSLSMGLQRSKTAFANTGPTMGTAAAASKKAAVRVTSRLSEVVKTKKNNKKKANLSRSSSTSSTKSLYHRHRLPRLQIPDSSVAVERALNSACSTDTQKSASYRILEMSPTSREIWHRFADDQPEDVEADLHNMFSARRRVRKSSFGAEVARYREARPTWDGSWCSRVDNDNLEDRLLLRDLTDALQDQKDHATRLVQENSSLYPGLRPVSAPGSTLRLHWQGKSSYR